MCFRFSGGGELMLSLGKTLNLRNARQATANAAAARLDFR